MDPNVLYAAGIGTPIVGGIGTLGLFGWSREMRRRVKKKVEQELLRRQGLLTGSYSLRPLGDIWSRSKGCGQITILVVGSYGARQLPFILIEFERAGAADHVGIIYLLELDEDERRMCLDNIPEAFRSKIVTVDCPNLSGGMIGDRIEDAQAVKELWWQDVMDGARNWLARIQRETKPVLLLCLLSPGGMAALGDPVLDMFHKRYPRIPIYLTTILDHKTIVRERFPQLRKLYGSNSRTRGMILMDNRRFSARSDLGIAMLFAAMVGSTWIDKLPLQLWNGAAYVFPKELPARFATISVWAEMLPVYYLPAFEKSLAEVFYTKGDLVEEKAIRGIRAVVEEPELQSLPLERAELGNTRICYVIAPIVPDPDFKRIARRVDENLEEWRGKTDQDLLIQYASIAAPLDPLTQEVPIVVVLLQPIKDEGDVVDALALGNHPVDSKFLPKPFGNGSSVLPVTGSTESETESEGVTS